MKKLVVFISSVFIFCTAFFEPAALMTDYRDAFIGTYLCNSSCKSLNAEQDSIIILSDTVTIYVAKDVLDSILQITIHSQKYLVKLMNSKMYPTPEGGRWSGIFFGADSLGFSVSVTHGPFSCLYEGKMD